MLSVANIKYWHTTEIQKKNSWTVISIFAVLSQTIHHMSSLHQSQMVSYGGYQPK